MSSYADYLHRLSSFLNPTGENLYGQYKRALDKTHGGNRSVLAHVPFYGDRYRLEEKLRKEDDLYKNTGRDREYGSDYGANPFASLGDGIGALMRPVRMAKTLSKMYKPEVELDIIKEKEELEMSRRMIARAYQSSAVLWHDAWDARNNKR